jgi:hypothetical protein
MVGTKYHEPDAMKEGPISDVPTYAKFKP